MTSPPARADGSVVCEADNDTTYSAGSGLVLTGTQFSVTGAPWSGLTGVPVGFADGVDDDTTYSAGSGLVLTGTQFSLDTAYTDGRYWRLGGNSLSAEGNLGATSNYALNFLVNNQRALRLEPNATSPNLIGGYSGNTVTSGVIGAVIAGGGASSGVNWVTDNYGVVGGGYHNQAGDNAGTTSDTSYATVGGGYSNTASGNLATVGGGGGNTASDWYAAVGGGEYNTASGYSATVGGGLINTASGYSAAVGGGYGNSASHDYAAVGGGLNNSASGPYATVSGGYRNTASQNYAAVGGGEVNIASGPYAAVGGGRQNTASREYATVSGGFNNTASGGWATVGGGTENTAAGNYSFVVGQRAKNTNYEHYGVFLFADGRSFDFPSTSPNQFRVRATGGAQFVLGINNDTGEPTWTCSVSNGVSWACSSDRNLKENLTLADGRAILETLNTLPLYTWNAIGADPSVQHLGPMAQDFYAAFGLGENDVAISTIDLDGVSLAAIQGLYQVVQEKDAQIAAQQAQIDDLQSRLSALESLVAQMAKGGGR